MAFAAGYYDGETYSHIWGSETKVVKWAVDKSSSFNGITYAHNGGRFDFPGYLFRGGVNLLLGEEIVFIGNRMVKVGFGNGELRDSYCILPAALSKFGGKKSIDYDKFLPCNRSQHRDEILAYLRSDCISLHEAISKFHDDHGTKVLTAASAAMKHAKKLGIEVMNLKEGTARKMRAFYFGGRCGFKKVGDFRGTIYSYDIKSAYPHAMIHQHPASEPILSEDCCYRRVKGHEMVVVRGEARGCFPERGEDGSLGFPHKRGTFYVTGWEYKQALDLSLFSGKILYKYAFEKTVDFRIYVDHYFAAKEKAQREGDQAAREIAKIMLNSLYGKFAQDCRDFKDYLCVPLDSSPVDDWEECYVDDENGFVMWQRPSTKEQRFFNVATASSITGFVRARIMLAITQSKGGALCWDTDGIKTTRKMETGEGLGSWQMEDQGERLLVSGKKMYAFHTNDGKWKIASKGVRLSWEQMEKLVNGEEVLYQQEAPSFSLKTGTKFIDRVVKSA